MSAGGVSDKHSDDHLNTNQDVNHNKEQNHTQDSNHRDSNHRDSNHRDSNHRDSNHVQESNHQGAPNPSQESQRILNSVGAVAAAAPVPVKSSRKRCPEDYKFGREIGQGSFSTVHIAMDVENEMEVAIKVIEKSSVIRNSSTRNAVWMERHVLQSCNHPLVGALIASFQDSARLYFVLPLAPHGELLKWLRKSPNGRFDLDTARFYASELLIALEYLHSQDIVHRDVKPENMLLGPNLHLMLVDFGSAIALNRADLKAVSFTGTAQFVSPEMLSGFRSILASANNTSSSTLTATTASGASTTTSPSSASTATSTSTTSSSSSESSSSESPAQAPDPALTYLMDFWALGCVLFQLITGDMPFRSDRPGHSELQDFELFHKVLNLDYRFPEDFPSPEAKDLIERLLVSDPAQRFGRPEDGRHQALKSHPFLAGIDWSDESALLERLPPASVRALVAGREVAPASQTSQANASNSSWALVPSGFNAAQRYHWEMEVIQAERADGPLMDIEGGALVRYLMQNGIALSANNDFVFPRREEYLTRQRSSNPYDQFTQGHLILDQGVLYKRRKLRARKRMFIMVEDIRLIYVDPDTMERKGIVRLSALTSFEIRKPKTFVIRTPGRDYVLDVPHDHPRVWMERVQRYWSLFFRSPG